MAVNEPAIHTAPTDPHDPNGISHSTKATRHLAKAEWAAWVEAWKDATRNSTALPGPFSSVHFTYGP